MATFLSTFSYVASVIWLDFISVMRMLKVTSYKALFYSINLPILIIIGWFIAVFVSLIPILSPYIDIV